MIGMFGSSMIDFAFEVLGIIALVLLLAWFFGRTMGWVGGCCECGCVDCDCECEDDVEEEDDDDEEEEEEEDDDWLDG